MMFLCQDGLNPGFSLEGIVHVRVQTGLFSKLCDPGDLKKSHENLIIPLGCPNEVSVEGLIS